MFVFRPIFGHFIQWNEFNPRKINADNSAAAGTVMIHAATIVKK